MLTKPKIIGIQRRNNPGRNGDILAFEVGARLLAVLRVEQGRAQKLVGQATQRLGP